MSQDHKDPAGNTDLRPSEDAWAALSAGEDDVSAAVAPKPAAAVSSIEADPEDDVAGTGDEDASIAADANEAAVQAAVAVAAAEEAAAIAAAPSRGGLFTIPLLCAGIAIIAACLIIPQADSNRRLAYARVKLQADLEAVEQQVQTNDQFLKKVANDANLAERLAQRQMKIIRQGNGVLKLKKTDDEDEMSPFQLTAIAAPPPLPPYQPRGGQLGQLCYDPKSRLYLMGLGLMFTAVGLVLGFGPRTTTDDL